MAAEPSPFDTVEAALAEIAAGRPIILTDDEDRENEGDFVLAASLATPQTVNALIRAGGLICVPMPEAQLRRLGIADMVQVNREQQGTAFAVSVDAAQGITTGISAQDRARTIQVLADPRSLPADLVQPGHIFPLRARPGGVLERAGHTEAAVDLAMLAGLPPVGAICEILNEDGSCARLPELVAIKERLGLKIISIAQLIHYRHQRERLVRPILKRPFKSPYGNFTLHIYQTQVEKRHHFALTLGELDDTPTLVRVHSENILRDVLQEVADSSVTTIGAALQAIAEAGRGVFLLMTHPAGGLNVAIDANRQAVAGGIDMDFRAYGVGAQILTDLGLRRIRLLTHSARRMVALEGYGLEITEQVSL